MTGGADVESRSLVPPPSDDRRWRRGVRVLGVVAALVTVAAAVPAVAGQVATVTLYAAATLWLVELLATPRDVRAEAALLVAVGLAGSLLDAVAAGTAGFLFAYFAAAAMGLRLPGRAALGAVSVVVLATAAAILLRGGDHTATSLTADVLGIAFAGSIAAATRSARQAHQRTASLVAELERSRAAQARAAALAERARLAREIHDVLAHSLTGQVMSLEAASMLAERTGADPRVRDQVERSRRLAKGGLAEVRQAISALRGEDLPGPALVPDLVEDVARNHGLPVDLVTHGTERPLAPEAGLTLYRTVQEALTNTTKHAGAGARSTVTLHWLEAGVEVTVSDERGARGRADLPRGGYGLTGLRERAELAGGSLTAGPTEDGFAVRLVLPYPAGDVR